MNLPDLKPQIEGIGRELLRSGTLNDRERQRLAEWTVGMAEAIAAGDKPAIEKYRIAFSAMVGVAELRAAQAGEQAALRLADLAVSVLTKVVLAALV